MKFILLITLIVAPLQTSTAPTWALQTSGTNARLRGISAVNSQVVWASGANSTVLRTTDGGTSWKKLFVTTEQLDFRDIDAVGRNTAYLLSIGNGAASRIYKTVDGGATWTMQFKNEDPKGFLDAISFWDAEHGIAFGDSIDGRFYILLTENGGRDWKRIPPENVPPALDGEGAFAASGTNIALFGKTHAWIGTGAAEKSRVLMTSDRGRTWKVADTPLNAGRSAGIFSIAFYDAHHGVVVGGDYTKEADAVNNGAITNDGGATWKLVRGLSGYRSVVAYVPTSKQTLIAVGPSGSDLSINGGNTWTSIAGPGFDTLSFPAQKSSTKTPLFAWAAGAEGRIGRLSIRVD